MLDETIKSHFDFMSHIAILIESASTRTSDIPILNYLATFGAKKAWELWNTDRAMDLKDPILENEASYPMLIRYINVAILCVQEIAADRPTMSEVVSVSQCLPINEHIVLPSPKQPAFSYLKSLQNSAQPMSRPGSCSVNNGTISLIKPR
ncbi:hypothetical protein Dsin_022731 [Dipteronia sinensis]|uniref:S-locus receptor kinase C-terminal domain-containing protein n=1 Tax=Dipteronia sinensis TaxID=43782 RepID=A0AAE0E077_9ROSI|nr:hypothetical protein Dsin_022731 [Dipteronia sinensis]